MRRAIIMLILLAIALAWAAAWVHSHRQQHSTATIDHQTKPGGFI